MHRATPDPPTEELIWFAWPQNRPPPAGRVEATDDMPEPFEAKSDDAPMNLDEADE